MSGWFHIRRILLLWIQRHPWDAPTMTTPEDVSDGGLRPIGDTIYDLPYDPDIDLEHELDE